jgi:hypothetical protein
LTHTTTAYPCRVGAARGGVIERTLIDFLTNQLIDIKLRSTLRAYNIDVMTTIMQHIKQQQ